jgi:hypothetical protein
VLRANMLDYISIDGHGQAQFNLSRLTRDQASVISELKVETRKPSRAGKTNPRAEIARLRLHDKLAAADKLLPPRCREAQARCAGRQRRRSARSPA